MSVIKSLTSLNCSAQGWPIQCRDSWFSRRSGICSDSADRTGIVSSSYFDRDRPFYCSVSTIGKPWRQSGNLLYYYSYSSIAGWLVNVPRPLRTMSVGWICDRFCLLVHPILGHRVTPNIVKGLRSFNLSTPKFSSLLTLEVNSWKRLEHYEWCIKMWTLWKFWLGSLGNMSSNVVMNILHIFKVSKNLKIKSFFYWSPRVRKLKVALIASFSKYTM